MLKTRMALRVFNIGFAIGNEGIEGKPKQITILTVIIIIILSSPISTSAFVPRNINVCFCVTFK